MARINIDDFLREPDIDKVLSDVKGKEEKHRVLEDLSRALKDYRRANAEQVQEALKRVRYRQQEMYAEEPSRGIDVVAQSEFLIPQLQELLILNIEKSGIKYAELGRAAKQITEPIWGTAIDQAIAKIDAEIRATRFYNLLRTSKLMVERRKVINRRQQGHNIYADKVEPQIVGCIVYGHNTASNTVRPYIRGSFLLGHNVLAGRPQEMMDDSFREHTTKNVDIANSVIFGWNAANDVQGGTIRDSIVCGYSPLARSEVGLTNCYVINPKGARKLDR